MVNTFDELFIKGFLNLHPGVRPLRTPGGCTGVPYTPPNAGNASQCRSITQAADQHRPTFTYHIWGGVS